MAKRGRPTKTQSVLNSLKSRPEIKTPVGTDMFLPNHSGVSTHKEFNHTLLSNIGINTHSQIDIHLSRSNTADFTIIDPNGVYGISPQVFAFWAIDDITITKIQIECDTNKNLNCDLKWADDFQDLTNATVIDVCDTGVDGKITITSGFDDATIASGKAVYFQMDATPDTDIKQVHVHIEWDYD